MFWCFCYYVLGFGFIRGLVKQGDSSISIGAGDEIYGGTTVPWANVWNTRNACDIYEGDLCEETEIRFDNGETASVSSDWVTNFFEVNEYLVKTSHKRDGSYHVFHYESLTSSIRRIADNRVD